MYFYPTFVYLNRKSSSFHGVFKPFDKPTWALLLSSCLATSFLLKGVSKLKFLWKLWWIYTIFLGQSTQAYSIKGFSKFLFEFLPLIVSYGCSAYSLGKFIKEMFLFAWLLMSFLDYQSRCKKYWKLQYLWLSGIYTGSGNVSMSAVKEYVVPSYISASKESGTSIPDLRNMLLTINVTIFTGSYEYGTIGQIASKNFTMIRNETSKKFDTFAIFDTDLSGKVKVNFFLTTHEPNWIKTTLLTTKVIGWLKRTWSLQKFQDCWQDSRKVVFKPTGIFIVQKCALFKYHKDLQ